MSTISVQELLNYINDARTNPKKFSEYIKNELDSFINQKSLPLKSNCTYSTFQGKVCWKEAYQYMRAFKPISPLQLNEGLSLAAMDHATDMKKNNFLDHVSSNGMSFGQRIERRCGQTYGSMAQNLGTDFDVNGRDHALQTILGLIVDDGVSSRGHRNNILSDKYKFCGIYAVKTNDRYVTCIKFHSDNVQTLNNSKEPLTGKLISKPNQTKNNFDKFNNFDDDFEKKFANMKLQQDHFNDKWKVNTNTSNNKTGQKYETSKSTSTKTSTVNGKTTKITTIKIVYSDGSTSEQVKEETY